MKRNVEGAKPISGKRYLNASRETKPYKILVGVSFAGKNVVLGMLLSCLFIWEDIIMEIERAMRSADASKGKTPAPGKLNDPSG